MAKPQAPFDSKTIEDMIDEYVKCVLRKWIPGVIESKDYSTAAKIFRGYFPFDLQNVVLREQGYSVPGFTRYMLGRAHKALDAAAKPLQVIFPQYLKNENEAS
jgi:hypothetical protein